MAATHVEITPPLNQAPLDETTKHESLDGSSSSLPLLSPSLADVASAFAFAIVSHRFRAIQEGRGADYLIWQPNEYAIQIIDEGSSNDSCTIFKVNVGLHESSPSAYTPKLISIGPYHKNNPKLGLMEKYKLRYQQRFLQREKGIDLESCIRELEKLKDKALKCYEDIEGLNNRKFLKMLLLDGCFVVEYLREFWGRMVPTGEDKIIKTAWMQALVDRDLLLLENQLPFFILAKLYEITNDTDILFMQMVKLNFSASLPKVTPKLIKAADGNVDEIKHLLQVVHLCCCPDLNTSLSGDASKNIKHSKTTVNWKRLQISSYKKKQQTEDEDEDIWHDCMRSVTELGEAGIRFSKVGKIYRKLGEHNEEDATTLFDIKFDKGVMEIPCFEVVHSTETVLRNLIAYEQHSSDVRPKLFTDYVIFMDHLINSGRDVNLLRMMGIIRNMIGDDIEVATMFNKLGEGVIPSTNFYYKEVCKKVVEHCEKPMNEKMANLRRNYFNGPWVGLSTAAAVLLIVLTFAQTVLAFISIFKK